MDELPRLLGDLTFYDPNVREAAATALGRLDDPRAIQPLVDNLNDPHRDSDPRVSEAIVDALARLGSPALEPLSRVLFSDRVKAAWAARALARIPGGNPAQRLVAALQVPELRRHAAAALWTWRDPASVPLLRATVQNPDSVAAGWAALALAQIEPTHVEAGGWLSAALQVPEQRLRWEAAYALLKSPHAAARGILLSAATDPSHIGRAEAAVALGETGDPRALDGLLAALRRIEVGPNRTWLNRAFQVVGRPAVAPLLEALQDSGALVRSAAAAALGHIRDATAVPSLIATLRDPVTDVREQAAEALCRLGDSRAVEALIAGLRDGEPAVRRESAVALGQIRDRRAVEPLLPLLRDPDHEVRRWTAFALGLLHDPRAVEPLIAALDDPDLDTARHAAGALGSIGDQRALLALQRLAELYGQGAPERRDLYLQATWALQKLASS